ncbi:hypothetical protein NDA10_007597 [Ustilago hordei]|nr:hypothetical protein NDA10_007597 [Ustilago hordei]
MSDPGARSALGSHANGRGTLLPSFKDLLCFSKSDTHEDPSLPSKLIRRGEDLRATHAAQPGSARHSSKDTVESKHTPHIDPRYSNSQNHQILQAPLHHGRSDPVTARYPIPSRSAKAPPNADSIFCPLPSRDLGPSARDESFNMRAKSDMEIRQAVHSTMTAIDTSRQNKETLVDRPTSHPMARVSKEYRPREERPSVHQSDQTRLMPANNRIHSYYENERPLPTQPIPSQGSHLMQQHQQHQQHQQQKLQRHHPRVDVRHTAQDDGSLIVRQHHPTHPQMLPVARPRMQPPPSPRAHVGDRQRQRSSPPSSRFIERQDGITHQSAHSHDISPRLPLHRSRETTFDYSCAKLPSDRSMSSPAMPNAAAPLGEVATPSRSRTYIPANEASEVQAASRQGLSSNTHAVLVDAQRVHDRPYLPTHSRDHMQVANRGESAALRYEQDYVRMSNGQLMRRSTASVKPQQRDFSSYQHEVQPQASVTRRQTSATAASQTYSMQPPLSAPVSSKNTVSGTPQLDSRATGAQRSWNDVQRPSDSYAEHRQDKLMSGMPHRTSPQDLLDQQQARPRGQERHSRAEHDADRFQLASKGQEPQRKERYEVREAVLNEGMRRDYQHGFVAPSIPSQERSAASERSFRYRQEGIAAERAHSSQIDPRYALRPQLPSPRSEPARSAQFDASFNRRQEYVAQDDYRTTPSLDRRQLPEVSIRDPRMSHRQESDRILVDRRIQQTHPPAVDQARRSTEREVPAIDKPAAGPPSQHEYRLPKNAESQRYRDLESPNAGTSDTRRRRYPPDESRASLVDPRSMERARAHPPIIASQHTISRTPPQGVADRGHGGSMSPLLRPLKRPRAGSDTSLVLKASRFTVGGEGEMGSNGHASVTLPSPLPAHRGRQLVGQRPLEQTGTPEISRDYRDAGKPVAVPQWRLRPATGSAPITPPLSSN